jgi:hypothetical protein
VRGNGLAAFSGQAQLDFKSWAHILQACQLSLGRCLKRRSPKGPVRTNRVQRIYDWAKAGDVPIDGDEFGCFNRGKTDHQNHSLAGIDSDLPVNFRAEHCKGGSDYAAGSFVLFYQQPGHSRRRSGTFRTGVGQ